MLLLDIYISTTRLTSMPKLEYTATLRVVVGSAIWLVGNRMHLRAIKHAITYIKVCLCWACGPFSLNNFCCVRHVITNHISTWSSLNVLNANILQLGHVQYIIRCHTEMRYLPKNISIMGKNFVIHHQLTGAHLYEELTYSIVGFGFIINTYKVNKYI